MIEKVFSILFFFSLTKFLFKRNQSLPEPMSPRYSGMQRPQQSVSPMIGPVSSPSQLSPHYTQSTSTQWNARTSQTATALQGSLERGMHPVRFSIIFKFTNFFFLNKSLTSVGEHTCTHNFLYLCQYQAHSFLNVNLHRIFLNNNI